MTIRAMLYFSLLSLTIHSCLPRQAGIADAGIVPYKKIGVADISFFGTITMDSSRKTKAGITVFYDDQEKIIALQAGSKNAPWYFYGKEGFNMLVSTTRSVRYVDTDTILFYKNSCYHKRVNYVPGSNNQPARWAGMTRMAVYNYSDDALSVSENSYYLKDSLYANESLLEFARNKEAGKQRALAPYRLLATGVDKDLSQLYFLRNHVFY
ncbi:MAG: hypothetical protein EOO03_08845 [Chitinophagaceae bacterium]|nr:MAG: hypothetical protein EOO03_08845 [Chitinophagaceae bacterium]